MCLRLAVLTILNGRFDHFLCLIGLVCSSFVTVSAGTHKRSPHTPLGECGVPFVDIGNLLASRLNSYPCTFVLDPKIE